MEMENVREQPTDDGLDRDAAMARSKTIEPLTLTSSPERTQPVNRADHIDTLEGFDEDIEVTNCDRTDTFATRDQFAVLKASSIAVGLLFLLVFGYMGFVILQ